MRERDFYTYSVLDFAVSSRKSWSTKKEAIKALRSYFNPCRFTDKKKRLFKYADGYVLGVVYHYYHYSDDIPYACKVLTVYKELFDVSI